MEFIYNLHNTELMMRPSRPTMGGCSLRERSRKSLFQDIPFDTDVTSRQYEVKICTSLLGHVFHHEKRRGKTAQIEQQI
jgi:hypothetical protein